MAQVDHSLVSVFLATPVILTVLRTLHPYARAETAAHRFSVPSLPILTLYA